MVAAALLGVVAGSPAVASAQPPAGATGRALDGTGAVTGARAGLPVKEMERILQADGTVSGRVLAVEIDRSDLHVTGGRSHVRFKTGFQVQHDITFQALPGGRAVLNADVAVRPGEIQPVIDTLLSRHLVFQAEHQHLYDISPMVWFIHFRGVGSPLQLAHDVHAVVRATGTPLPASSPPHPTSPLPTQRLGRILGGDATVGANGVVTVSVPRRSGVLLGGVPVSPELNIANTIQFQPLGGGRAAAIPDFAMTAAQVQPVVRLMRGYGWEIGCLYNQETAEHPQLYFSHQFNTGNPITLAEQMRKALDRTDAEG